MPGGGGGPLDFEFQVRDVEQLNRALSQINAQLGRMEGGQNRVNRASQGTFGADAVAMARQFVDVVQRAWSVASDFGAEMERQVAVLENFGGSIDEASRRTNHLFTQMQLMTASSRATNAGLQLTEHQFANLAVAADTFADRIGGDGTQALEQLTQALVTGSTRSLRQFGLALEGGGNRTQQTAHALRMLEEQFGATEAEADTFGGRLAQVENALEDAKLELFEMTDSSRVLDTAWDELSQTGRDFGEFLGVDLPGPLEIVNELMLGFTVIFRNAGQAVRSLGEAISQLSTGDLHNAREALMELGASGAATFGFGTAGEQLDAARRQQAADRAQRDVERFTRGVEQRSRTRRGGGGGGGGRNRLQRDLRELAEGMEAPWNQGLVDPSARGGSLPSGQEFVEIGDIQAGQKNALIEAELELTEKLAEIQAEANEAYLAGKAKELEALEQAADAERERMELIAQAGEAAISMSMGLVRAAVEGGAERLKVEGKRVAIENTWEGLEALARAPLLFWTRGPQAAGSAVLTAGQHFALAALAGGAAGIGAAASRGGGGGGGGRGGDSDRRGSPSSRQMRGSGGSDQKPPDINVYFYSAVDEARMGLVGRRTSEAFRGKFKGRFS